MATINGTKGLSNGRFVTATGGLEPLRAVAGGIRSGDSPDAMEHIVTPDSTRSSAAEF